MADEAAAAVRLWAGQATEDPDFVPVLLVRGDPNAPLEVEADDEIVGAIYLIKRRAPYAVDAYARQDE
jgi:hypothetical protein